MLKGNRIKSLGRPVTRNCNATGKVGFLHRADAAKAKKRAKHREGEAFDVYRCSVCGLYHIGHTNKRG